MKHKIKSFLKIILNLVSLFIFFWGLHFLGFKGLIGLVLGMFSMSWLLLSNNPLLLYFINYISEEDCNSVYEFIMGRKNEK